MDREVFAKIKGHNRMLSYEYINPCCPFPNVLWGNEITIPMGGRNSRRAVKQAAPPCHCEESSTKQSRHSVTFPCHCEESSTKQSRHSVTFPCHCEESSTKQSRHSVTFSCHCEESSTKQSRHSVTFPCHCEESSTKQSRHSVTFPCHCEESSTKQSLVCANQAHTRNPFIASVSPGPPCEAKNESTRCD